MNFPDEPLAPTGVRVLPFWEYPTQPRAEDIVRKSHEDALWAIGEPVFFFLMWRASDFDLGLVDHCSLCWTGSREAEAFRQPTRNKCVGCYGTGFEGGYRARIVRPAIVTDRISDDKYENRGEIETDDLTFETTTDFHVRQGDYIVRHDNNRYQCDEMNEVIIRSGFGPPISESSVSGIVQHAHLLPKTDVAYMLPPTQPVQVEAILTAMLAHIPPDPSEHEQIRGPLIVGDN